MGTLQWSSQGRRLKTLSSCGIAGGGCGKAAAFALELPLTYTSHVSPSFVSAVCSYGLPSEEKRLQIVIGV